MQSSEAVRIPSANVTLEGDLALTSASSGLVIFAHGSGSSRHSPRNRAVARILQQAGLSTLLFDLLTTEEERVDAVTAHLRFNIPLLAERLAGVTEWLRSRPGLPGRAAGYFGASTGAAAALVAAAVRPDAVGAIVSRGGRPDLAGDALPRVTAPTLLIVGARDEPVVEMNRAAMREMRAPVRLEVVAGASHLFEEPGTLEQAASLAAGWFSIHLRPLF